MRKKNFYKFDIDPVPKPRMVRSDTWAGRPAVTSYWLFKDKLVRLARKSKFVLPEKMELYFHIPMPDSWSQKKKDKMENTYHQARPDIDNLLKAFLDCLADEDKKVCKVVIEKRWSTTGKIWAREL